MRFALLLTALSAAVLLPAASAHADTISTFQLSGQFQYQPGSPTGSAAGTLTIDTTTGTVLGVNLTYSQPFGQAPGYNDGVSVLPAQPPYFPWTEVVQSWSASPQGQGVTTLDIRIPGSSLVNYPGGNICSVANPCFSLGSSVPTYSEFGTIRASNFINGELTLASTPEPSSLALLGTGLLGLIGTARRKLMAS